MNRNQRKQIKSVLRMKKCRYCKSTENLTIDHKIPKIIGGTDDLTNLQCLCKRCNQMKSGMSDRQVRSIWKWLLEVQRGRLEHGSKPYGTQ